MLSPPENPGTVPSRAGKASSPGNGIRHITPADAAFPAADDGNFRSHLAPPGVLHASSSLALAAGTKITARQDRLPGAGLLTISAWRTCRRLIRARH